MQTSINYFASILCIFCIVTIPILFAAVQPWIWSSYSLIIIGAFIIYLLTAQDQNLFDFLQNLNINAIIFFSWTLILCIPLPYPIISVLSPNRFETLQKTWELTGNMPTWASISYLPYDAFGWWVFLLGLGLLYFVIRMICSDRKTLKVVFFALCGIGLIEALYGLIQALVPSMGVLWVDYVPEYMGNARGTFINRNHFAGFVEMIWPLMLGYALAITDMKYPIKNALASDSLNRQALMSLGIVIMLLALLLSQSRAGIAGGLVGLATFWYMARPRVRNIALTTRLTLGGIVVFLIVYCALIGVGPVFERFLSIDDSNSRIEIWNDSLVIFKDHLFGIGFRNYENVFAVYNQSISSEKLVNHAHNDYLQILIETGWIGFLTLVGGFLFFITKSVRRIKRLDFPRDPLRFYLAVGAFSGLVSIAFHSFFDFNLQIPANCLYFVVLMAILSACVEQTRRSPSPKNFS
jgi:O-antigen ligase